jgi:hypothetical protein
MLRIDGLVIEAVDADQAARFGEPVADARQARLPLLLTRSSAAVADMGYQCGQRHGAAGYPPPGLAL